MPHVVLRVNLVVHERVLVGPVEPVDQLLTRSRRLVLPPRQLRAELLFGPALVDSLGPLGVPCGASASKAVTSSGLERPNVAT